MSRPEDCGDGLTNRIVILPQKIVSITHHWNVTFRQLNHHVQTLINTLVKGGLKDLVVDFP